MVGSLRASHGEKRLEHDCRLDTNFILRQRSDDEKEEGDQQRSHLPALRCVDPGGQEVLPWRLCSLCSVLQTTEEDHP